MILGVLTSNHHRHRYFANYLAHRLPVKIVVSEPKTAEPFAVGQSEDDNRLLTKYFVNRLEAEQEILGGQKFDLPESVTLIETSTGGINDPTVCSELQSAGVDTLAVFGTGLIKAPLLSVYDGKIFNIHLGLSPYYRGSATNFWTMYNEDLHMVGATIHYIDAGVDTGDIICHVHVPVQEDDSPHTLGNRAIKTAVQQIAQVLEQVDRGPTLRVPQWKPALEHVYRRRDFTPGILRDFLSRWDNGLVSRFMERRKRGELENVALVSLSV